MIWIIRVFFMFKFICIYFYVNVIFCKFIVNFCCYFFCNKTFFSILSNKVRDIKYFIWVLCRYLVIINGYINY